MSGSGKLFGLMVVMGLVFAFAAQWVSQASYDHVANLHERAKAGEILIPVSKRVPAAVVPAEPIPEPVEEQRPEPASFALWASIAGGGMVFVFALAVAAWMLWREEHETREGQIVPGAEVEPEPSQA